MPIKRYSKLLKDIRKTRHLTQENFADGIYSPVSLSRIENGKSGMKKDNFELLMKKHNIESIFIQHLLIEMNIKPISLHNI